MSDIVEFLRARLDEEGVRAAGARGHQTGSRFDGQPLDWVFHAERWTPERVLAEVEAKRKIIELAEEASSLDMQVDGEFRVGPRDTAKEPYIGDWILRSLASVYADHPDYDQEWSL